MNTSKHPTLVQRCYCTICTALPTVLHLELLFWNFSLVFHPFILCKFHRTFPWMAHHTLVIPEPSDQLVCPFLANVEVGSPEWAGTPQFIPANAEVYSPEQACHSLSIYSCKYWSMFPWMSTPQSVCLFCKCWGVFPLNRHMLACLSTPYKC